MFLPCGTKEKEAVIIAFNYVVSGCLASLEMIRVKLSTSKKREVKERSREETGGVEVEGHDPAPAVLHEVVAVRITGAEAQAVDLDIGREANEGTRGTKRNTYAVYVFLQQVD